jgi:hypothetical protein
VRLLLLARVRLLPAVLELITYHLVFQEVQIASKAISECLPEVIASNGGACVTLAV